MRPLLTLAINCYKFERFIDEALDGAFAQTYRPLEIVISDDHSPDGTWEKIQAKVKEFLAGHSEVPCRDFSNEMFPQTIPAAEAPLSIILNRNGMNLGLARHQNRLFELSHGEWIAFQSGDDVSTADRMSKIYETVAVNPKIRCLHCRTRVIDAEGQDVKVPEYFLKEQARPHKKNVLPSILGAGAVYHCDVYRLFGPLGPYVGNEDHVLPFRAKLLGDIAFTEQRLVCYRKHGANESGSYVRDAKAIARYRLQMMYMYYQELSDLHHAEIQRMIGLADVMHYCKLIDQQLYIMWFLGSWFSRSEWRGKLLLCLFISPMRVWQMVNRVMSRLRMW